MAAGPRRCVQGAFPTGPATSDRAAQVLPVAMTTWVTNAATIRTPQMTAAMIKRLVLTPRQVSQRSVRQLNLDGG